MTRTVFHLITLSRRSRVVGENCTRLSFRITHWLGFAIIPHNTFVAIVKTSVTFP